MKTVKEQDNSRGHKAQWGLHEGRTMGTKGEKPLKLSKNLHHLPKREIFFTV